MTIEEMERKVHIRQKDLWFYEQQGLLNVNEVQTGGEKELSEVRFIDDLAKIGMTLEELKQMKALMQQKGSSKDDQIRLLKKWRFKILEDIHAKQQSLDRLDYMIYRMKQNGGEYPR